MERFSEYRVMWVLVFFDLPTETKKDRKNLCYFSRQTYNRRLYNVSIFDISAALPKSRKCRSSYKTSKKQSPAQWTRWYSLYYRQIVWQYGTFLRTKGRADTTTLPTTRTFLEK